MKSPIYINKTFTDNLITQIYDDFYLKLKIDGLFSNINISNYYDKSYIDYLNHELPTQFLNTYTKTEVDSLLATINLADYYNKTEMDLIVPNIDLINYYTKTEVDDIDNELSTLILNTCTKTDIDDMVLLYDSYVDGNFYNKTDTDNVLSGLVTTDYLNLKYTNSVDLSSNYYNKTDSTFEVQKTRAMSAVFPNIADAVFSMMV